ncbi:hypothetical protein KY084_03355 [Stakelama sp. CBK3Z-3]|uniref:UrcA family protein n=1 Tax=Stakelama flava TaxID=2860338 RepID=A0ABS6XKK2_9SPHN|nr:hypothetical protein [Stakelama flava]MBW4329911.1 hypothetical protein [Stakelama flava]
MKKILILARLAVLPAVAGIATNGMAQTAPTQQQGAQAAQVDALVRQILQSINTTPNADAQTFEGRFALLADQKTDDCLIARRAVMRAWAETDNSEAKKALKALRNTLAACPTGTGAGGSGYFGPSVAQASLPAIQVGGGSDYLP